MPLEELPNEVLLPILQLQRKRLPLNVLRESNRRLRDLIDSNEDRLTKREIKVTLLPSRKVLLVLTVTTLEGAEMYRFIFRHGVCEHARKWKKKFHIAYGLSLEECCTRIARASHICSFFTEDTSLTDDIVSALSPLLSKTQEMNLQDTDINICNPKSKITLFGLAQRVVCGKIHRELPWIQDLKDIVVLRDDVEKAVLLLTISSWGAWSHATLHMDREALIKIAAKPKLRKLHVASVDGINEQDLRAFIQAALHSRANANAKQLDVNFAWLPEHIDEKSLILKQRLGEEKVNIMKEEEEYILIQYFLPPVVAHCGFCRFLFEMHLCVFGSNDTCSWCTDNNYTRNTLCSTQITSS